MNRSKLDSIPSNCPVARQFFSSEFDLLCGLCAFLSELCSQDLIRFNQESSQARSLKRLCDTKFCDLLTERRSVLRALFLSLSESRSLRDIAERSSLGQ